MEEGQEGRHRDEKGEIPPLCLTLADLGKQLQSSDEGAFGSGGIFNTPVLGVPDSDSTILYNMLCSPLGASLQHQARRPPSRSCPARLSHISAVLVSQEQAQPAGETLLDTNQYPYATPHFPVFPLYKQCSSEYPCTGLLLFFFLDKSYSCIFFSRFCLLIDSHPIMYQLTFQPGALSITLIQSFDFFFSF